MKRRKNEIEKSCAVCENAEEIFDEDNVLCKKYGIVLKSHICRKFIYDPLKRIPSKTPALEPLEYVDIDEEK